MSAIYQPGTHASHEADALFCWNLPGGHSSHRDAPLGAYVPGGQVAQFETPPSLPDLMEAVFGEVPLPFVGLRLGFLLGYVDWVGLGEHYR